VTTPGILKDRLTLEIPVETPDGAGGVVRTYVAGPRLWAAVIPASTRDVVIAEAAGARLTHHITVRTGIDITTAHRLRKGARLFRILGYRDEDASGRYLRIEAEERRD
jgi:SPP1 family predicted phage head-tail adaptor